jgi:outer membrane protein assembly factor BamB
MRLTAAILNVASGLTLFAGPAIAENWPMYGGNLRHTFSNHDSSITAMNVGRLEKSWSFTVGDAISASPTIVNGVVYVGSWDGYFYAINARSGSLIWKFQVDCQNTIIPIPPQCLAPDQTPPLGSLQMVV